MTYYKVSIDGTNQHSRSLIRFTLFTDRALLYRRLRKIRVFEAYADSKDPGLLQLREYWVNINRFWLEKVLSGVMITALYNLFY